MADVRALIMTKQEKNAGKKLIWKDVNRDLIVALLAIPVYGKEARDEEILSVIINAGVRNRREAQLRDMRDKYNQAIQEKKIKKSKTGETRDADGFLYLEPRL